MGVPFSLLLPVYAGDRADYLHRAFTSTVNEQTLRPDEVVLVQDGPVSAEVAAEVRRLVAASPVPVRLLVLPRNVGLADALYLGLDACRYEVVARMDADDVSLPHRFERQLPVIEAGADLVGAGLLEIGDDECVVRGRRVPPAVPDLITASARLHDPFNHPTVVYRRSAVHAAGGYQPLPLMEDYWLFVRMIVTGARVANLPEPLVKYRVGPALYARRGGLRLLRSELLLQRQLRRIGFTSRVEYTRNVVVRGGYRLVPSALRRAVYERLVATRGERLDASALGVAASGPPGAPTPATTARGV